MNEALFEQDLPEQVRLARRNGIGQILLAVPEINGNERMLLRRMTRVFYESDPTKSWELWSKITPQTDRQSKAFDLSTDTFADLHQQAQKFLATEGTNEALEAMIRSYREKDSPRGPGYRWNDSHQVSQRERRSVAQLQNSGIRISMPPEKLEVLGDYLEERPGVSLLESAKNERFAIVNGFKGALMTLVIHDPYDHFFATSKLRATGLEEEYRDFFDAVGNPHDTDLFSREGELIAAISYGYRVWGMVEPGIQPTLTANRVNRAIQKSPNSTPNQERVSRILEEQIIPNTEEARKYGYIVTSVIIELLEQRRKQGFIRTLDKDRNIVGTLPLMDPEYLALIIDTTKMLSEAEPSSQTTAGNIGVLIEEYLHYVASPNFILGKTDNLPPNLQDRVAIQGNDAVPTLTFSMPDIMDKSIVEQTTVPQPVAEWIVNNPGFTATQQPLVK